MKSEIDRNSHKRDTAEARLFNDFHVNLFHSFNYDMFRATNTSLLYYLRLISCRQYASL